MIYEDFLIHTINLNKKDCEKPDNPVEHLG